MEIKAMINFKLVIKATAFRVIKIITATRLRSSFFSWIFHLVWVNQFSK